MTLEQEIKELEKQYLVEKEEGFARIIVIDNLPIVDSAKLAKLTTVLIKILSKEVENIVSDAIFMPFNSENTSNGYAFVTLTTPASVKKALKSLNGYKLDKSHVLQVNLFDDIEKFANLDETFIEPKPEKFIEKDHLKSWLADDLGRDQWLIYSGDQNVSVFWNNKADDPQLEISKMDWCDFNVQWSPKGTYLVTFHHQGLRFFGGPQFSPILRFLHPDVKLLDLSPNEKFAVTWSLEPFKSEDGSDHNIIVWDVSTAQQLRTFAFDLSTVCPAEDAKPAQKISAVKANWPLFKWSFDDRYLARLTTGQNGMISVYETPSMNLLNKSSIKIPNVEFFEWSPAESILSYYTPENGNIPARVTLMRIPNREILRTKNLFSVVECRMFWQSAGTYLLVKVSLLKSKKHQATNLEIFRVTEKDCPVEVLEFKTGETVSIISWETNGDKFISVSQEAQKQFINLYQMLPATNASVERIRLLKTMERRGINRISWSPAGRFVVLAHIGVGDVEFWDSEELNMVGSGEHYQLTDVEWDPTGRFVVSSVSFYQVSSDNGYMLWSFTGQLLHKQMIPKFKALNWRNRPASLLSKDQQAQIRRNFKEYSKEYDIMDIAQTNKASKDVVEKRVNAWLEWVEFRRKCAFEYVLPKAADDQVFDEVEEIFEEVIDEVEEEVKDTGYKLDDD